MSRTASAEPYFLVAYDVGLQDRYANAVNDVLNKFQSGAKKSTAKT